MAQDWRTLQEFDSKRQTDWTSNIDLSVFDKMIKAFATIQDSAKKSFKSLEGLSFDSAVKSLEQLNNGIALADKRYAELVNTASQLRGQASSGGDDAKELLKKASAAERYARELSLIKSIYDNIKWNFAEGTKNTKDAWSADAQKQIAENAKRNSDLQSNQIPAVNAQNVEETTQKVVKLEDEIDKVNNKPINIPVEQATSQVESLTNKVEEVKSKSSSALERFGNTPSDVGKEVLKSIPNKTGVDVMQSLGKLYPEWNPDKTIADVQKVKEQIDSVNSTPTETPTQFIDLREEIKKTEDELEKLIKLDRESGRSSFSDKTAEKFQKLQELKDIRDKHFKDQGNQNNPPIPATPSAEKKGLTPEQAKERRAQLIAEGKYKDSDNSENKSANGAPFVPYDGTKETIQNYEQLTSAIERLKEQASTLRSVLQSNVPQGQGYESTLNILTEVEAKLKELEKTKSLIDKGKPPEVVSPEPFKADPKNYQELVGWIDTLKSKIAELSQNAQNGQSTNFEKDSATIAEYSNELKRLEGMKASFDKGSKLVASDEEPKIQGVLGLLKETISTKAQLAQQNMSIFSTSNMGETMSNIQGLNGKMKELGEMWKTVASNSILVSALKTIGTTAKNVATTIGNGLVQGFKMAINGAKQLASTLMNLASGAFNALKSAISTTLGNMRKLVSGGFNAVKNGVAAAKSGFNTLKSTMQSIVKKGTPNLMKSFSSIKSMLMRRVKRTFISAIFNQAKEGLQQLAKSSESFNQSMSNIKNTAKQVAGNMAITLGNLLQTIEPVLQTVLGWLNKVLEAINGLFAMLSGKKTMLVAKKGTDNYAKSLNSASGAAKDLNNQLYGFDEITRQEDNSGGGGGGGGKIGYEEQPIEEAMGGINDFFKQMLDAFNAGEFEKVGQLIGEQLNNLISIVDKFIVDLGPKAIQWSENIASIFNGLVEGINWESLGNLFADGLNVVFGVVNKFLTKFKFKNLGKKVANAFKGLFSKIDANLIGETVANYFNMLPQFLAGLFEDMPWDEIGKKFKNGLQSFFDNIDWGARQSAISNGINGITKVLTQIVTGVKWGELATTLGNHINATINSIKWGDIANLVSTGINKIIEAFGNLIDTNFFVNLASKLGETLGGILNNINWSGLASDIVTGLAQLRTAFWTLIDNLNLPDLATKLANGINSLLTDEKVSKAWDESHDEAKKGLGKIEKAFHNLVTNINFEDIMSKLGSKVGDLLDSVDFNQLGRDVRVGLQKVTRGFTNLVKNIDFPTIATNVGEGVKSLFAKDAEGKTVIDDIAVLVSTGLQSAIDSFVNFYDSVNFPQVASDIAKGIETIVKNIDFSELLRVIGDGVASASSAFFKLVSDVFTDGEDEQGNKLESLGTKLSNGINKMFKDDKGNVDTSKFSDLGKNFGEAIKNIFNDISTFMKKTDWADIGKAVGRALANIDWIGIGKSILEFLWNGLIAGLELVGGFMATVIKRLLGIPDYEVIKGETLAWANMVAEATDESFQSGTVKERLAKTASMYATGLGKELLNHAKETEEYSGAFAERTADTLKSVFTSVQNGSNETAVNLLINALGLDDAEGQLGRFVFELSQKATEELGQLRDIDLLSGIFENSESEEKLIEYFSSLGIKAPEELIEKLVGAIPRVDAAAQKLLQNIQDTNEWQKVKEAFGNAGVEISDELAQSFIGIGRENVAMALALMGKGIDDDALAVLNSLDLSDNINAFVTESGTTVEEAALALLAMSGKDITEMADKLGIDVGKIMALTVPEGMAEGMEEGEKTVANAVEKLKKSAEVSDEQQQDVENAGIKTGQSGTEGIVGGTEAGQPEVEEATGNVTSAVTEAYEALPEEVKPYAEQLMTYIATALSDGDGTVKSAIDAVANAAVESAREILSGDTGTEIAKAFVDGIKDYFSSESTLSEIKGEGGVATKYAQTIKGAVQDVLTESTGLSIGDAFGYNIKYGISNTKISTGYDYSVEDWANNIKDTVSTILSFENGDAIGSDFAEAITSGISLTDIVAEIQDWAWYVINTADAILSYSNGYTIGNNVIVGMINGFSAYGQTLVDTIAHICKVSAQTAREILGIASPSKVFAEIGEYTMEGFQIGLEKNGKDAINTVGDISQAIVEEAKNGNAIEMEVGSMVDGLDTVTDKMSRLAQIFSDIANTIADMGGLPIPTVANGQVLPYRTRVDTQSVNTTSTLDGNSLENALYSAFTRAMGTYNNEQQVNITLQIDGRKMADIVSKYQRQQDRAWGV